MALALFDLDNTLIDGDSDHLWGEFAVEQKIVDGEAYRRQNDAFYEDYLRGDLDMVAYQHFCLTPLKQFTLDELNALHSLFLSTYIKPIIKPKTAELLQQHKDKGDLAVIITATNRFVTGPIATALGIKHLIATEPELIDDRYTGKLIGTPCYQTGKIERLSQWMVDNQIELPLKEAYFYSDSHNDLPLLNKVGNPIVVDGDERLSKTAASLGWPHISLK